jgi:hypothetical protein
MISPEVFEELEIQKKDMSSGRKKDEYKPLTI